MWGRGDPKSPCVEGGILRAQFVIWVQICGFFYEACRLIGHTNFPGALRYNTPVYDYFYDFIPLSLIPSVCKVILLYQGVWPVTFCIPHIRTRRKNTGFWNYLLEMIFLNLNEHLYECFCNTFPSLKNSLFIYFF